MKYLDNDLLHLNALPQRIYYFLLQEYQYIVFICIKPGLIYIHWLKIMHQVIIQQNEGNKHWKFQVKDSAMKEESAYYQYSLQSLVMFPTMHLPPLVMAAVNGLQHIYHVCWCVSITCTCSVLSTSGVLTAI